MGATEEKSKSTLQLYPEMILVAIDELGETEGSHESAISKYIEATYGDRLREGHAERLSEALEQMWEKGELVLVNNKYKKSNAKAPQRRGRGRPPKPKQSLPAGPAPASPRPRGRPPKDKSAGGHPKPRGRPPKQTKSSDDAARTAPPSGQTQAVVGVKRGRGRPPKVRPAAAAVADMVAE
ncbi:HMG-Y-related protein A [Apostasia shenzhenica]|uniref:HMG-Y-related protein A n=1 Tax=Apostasia shenzhenica TaxID=1088818 RepID=A0A2I0B0W4_9ASPA|nr:HMG-Y-related protein A [Apostasia shenzhenica]